MRTLTRSALALALVAIAAALLLRGPRLTEQQVRETIFSSIEEEHPEAFLVTGRLDLTVTTRIEDSRVLLPGLVGLDLGTARATVRVPGRVSYGFPADALRPEMVRLLDDGTIEIDLPGLSVYSAEPDLAAMEVETERGWARLPGVREDVERQAVAIIEGALRRQGAAHLSASHQPGINSARALQRLLSPALQGLGMDRPSFRFRLGDDLVVEPSG
ncbi:MAG: DUF4230 domain-containing protein [Longimicrobiales bacterium]|nr:DUF4230 domain-containing protein [Longimicrobiales bacterium]